MKLSNLSKIALSLGLAFTVGCSAYASGDKSCDIHGGFKFCLTGGSVAEASIVPPWSGYPRVVVKNNSDKPATYQVQNPIYRELTTLDFAREFTWISDKDQFFTLPPHGEMEVPYIAQDLVPGREYYFAVVNQTARTVTYLSLSGATVTTKWEGPVDMPPAKWPWVKNDEWH